MSPTSNPRKRCSDALSTTPTASNIGRKRQKHTAKRESSAGSKRSRQEDTEEKYLSNDKNKKRQQTLTQLQFVPRPPGLDVDIVEDELDFIQEKPTPMTKKISRRSMPKQKSTLTQMDCLARTPLHLRCPVEDLELDCMEWKQKPNAVNATEIEETTEAKMTPSPAVMGSSASNRLKPVIRPSTTVKKKKSKQKIDPWEVSSSQPEMRAISSPIEEPLRITSPRSTRPAKAAAVRKLKSLHLETKENNYQQMSQLLHEDPDCASVEPTITTPRKLPRRRLHSINEVIPSSQSPESLPPSTQRKRDSIQRDRFENRDRSPLAERSLNVPPPAATASLSSKNKLTMMLKNIDRERTRRMKTVQSQDFSNSAHKVLIVKLPVRWPRRAGPKPDTDGSPGNESPHIEASNARDEPQNCSPLPPLKKQPSKLLVDGWPELEELLGRPSARSEGIREPLGPILTKHIGLKGTHEQETQYAVGEETQLMFANMEAPVKPQIDTVSEKETMETGDHKTKNGTDVEANDDTFSLGSPVLERSPHKSGLPKVAHEVRQRSDSGTQSKHSIAATDIIKCLPNSSATQSPFPSTHKSSPQLTRSEELPSLPRQSQVSTQYATQQPPPSTYPASSHRYRSSPSHQLLTIKDSDSSLPLHEIPAHYFNDSEEEAPFDGDLDPTPRRSEREKDFLAGHPSKIDLNFSPPASSPSLPPLPIGGDGQLRNGDARERMNQEENLSSSPILKNGIRYLRESLLESLPGPPPPGTWDETEDDMLEEIV
ncbi:MAG: hypothetical protein Q9160_002074 [Pyrenula sp. 1 TL-2023]